MAAWRLSSGVEMKGCVRYDGKAPLTDRMTLCRAPRRDVLLKSDEGDEALEAAPRKAMEAQERAARDALRQEHLKRREDRRKGAEARRAAAGPANPPGRPPKKKEKQRLPAPPPQQHAAAAAVMPPPAPARAAGAVVPRGTTPIAGMGLAAPAGGPPQPQLPPPQQQHQQQERQPHMQGAGTGVAMAAAPNARGPGAELAKPAKGKVRIGLDWA